jgi:hypothetical protein
MREKIGVGIFYRATHSYGMGISMKLEKATLLPDVNEYNK